MGIINWLLLIEVIACAVLVVWLVRRAHKHVKKNPAQVALEQHLAELEAEKVHRQKTAKAKSKKVKS